MQASSAETAPAIYQLVWHRYGFSDTVVQCRTSATTPLYGSRSRTQRLEFATYNLVFLTNLVLAHSLFFILGTRVPITLESYYIER